MTNASQTSGDRVRRALIPVGDRFVHIRYAGVGRVLVMLHECPRSSLSMLPLMEKLKDRFFCIAIDIPGYGDSDRLAVDSDSASIENFAECIDSVVTTLGLNKLNLYGTHTGAAIAVEYAKNYSKKISHLYLDGPAIFSETEKVSMVASYLPELGADRSGVHLNKIWTRILDQQTYFPFYERKIENRVPAVEPDLEYVHRTAMGFLEAGEDYITAYRAAITYDMASVVKTLDSSSYTISCLKSDLLITHLNRLDVPTHQFNENEQTASFIALRSQGGDHINDPDFIEKKQSDKRFYLSLDDCSVYIQANDIPYSCFSSIDPNRLYTKPMSESTLANFLDLPGLGRSAWDVGVPYESVQSYRKALSTIITEIEKKMGWKYPAISARIRPSNCLTSSVSSLSIEDMYYAFSDVGVFTHSVPDLDLDWSGAHLYKAWVFARNVVEKSSTHGEFSEASLLDKIHELFMYTLRSREVANLFK
jgi:pimeloyl-ACP methyl ester carboxylesterase